MKEMVNINQTEYNLDEILNDCWLRLEKGVKSANHPFHSPTLGTIHQGEVEMRTVILRQVIAAEKTLIFHSDVRSPKISQIKNNNHISWLFYDEDARIQIRLKAKATIHHLNDLALSRWEDSRLESRRCYLSQPAPSSFIDFPSDGLPENLDVKNLTVENVADGFNNFVVVETEVTQIEWLFLNHSGHRRATFSYDGNIIKKQWMLP